MAQPVVFQEHRNNLSEPTIRQIIIIEDNLLKSASGKNRPTVANDKHFRYS